MFSQQPLHAHALPQLSTLQFLTYLNTSTSTLITREPVGRKASINFSNVTLSSLLHRWSCWDLLHWQVQGAGPVLQSSLRQAICQWTHTHRHTLSCQPGRQTTMWEFSHSAEEACCANSLHDWALPNKHTPVQSTRRSSGLNHATAPKVCVLRCVNVCVWGGGISQKNLPLWNILHQWWIYYTPCQRCNLNLFTAHLSGHAQSFSGRRVVQHVQNAQRKKPLMFSIMVDSL